jgi:hypothetical protein
MAQLSSTGMMAGAAMAQLSSTDTAGAAMA